MVIFIALGKARDIGMPALLTLGESPPYVFYCTPML